MRHTLLISFCLLPLLEGVGRAQCPDEQRKAIYKLNQKALEAYSNMEFEEAKKRLSEAFEKAKGTDCAFDWVHAYTLLNLGILSIGAYGKEKLGLRFFEAALRVRPEASLDPKLATPKMARLFQKARKRMKIVEEPAPWPRIRSEVRLSHQPPPSARQGTDLRLVVRVQGEAASVKLFFRRAGQEAYQEHSMEGAEAVWKAVLPGTSLQPGMLQYYFEAYDEGGERVGRAGGPDDPYEVLVAGAPKPRPSRRKKPAKKNIRRIWLLVGAGWGFGYAQGQVDVLDERGGVASQTGLPRDRIEDPGLGPGSVGLSLEVGFLVTPVLLLSLQGYVGMVGPLTSNVPDPKPVDGWAFLRVRYLSPPMAGGWLRLLTGGGIGFAVARHLVEQNLETGSYRDTDTGMGIAPQASFGLVIGPQGRVQGFLDLDFFLTAWTDTALFTFHSDVTMGVAVSF